MSALEFMQMPAGICREEKKFPRVENGVVLNATASEFLRANFFAKVLF